MKIEANPRVSLGRREQEAGSKQNDDDDEKDGHIIAKPFFPFYLPSMYIILFSSTQAAYTHTLTSTYNPETFPQL